MTVAHSFWLCGCGYTATDIEDGARCFCGLNPLATGTWRRFGHRGGWRWWFVRNLSEPMQLQILGCRDRGEVLGVRVGDLGSVCGRWTVEMLAPVETPELADAWHDGKPYRFVRRGDRSQVPWLLTLMQTGLVYCSDPSQQLWMLLDAFTLGIGEVASTVDPPLEFLIGRQFSDRIGRA